MFRCTKKGLTVRCEFVCVSSSHIGDSFHSLTSNDHGVERH